MKPFFDALLNVKPTDIVSHHNIHHTNNRHHIVSTTEINTADVTKYNDIAR